MSGGCALTAGSNCGLFKRGHAVGRGGARLVGLFFGWL